MNPSASSPEEVRSHLHAIVGLAERIVAESKDQFAHELATAICHQTRYLLGDAPAAIAAADVDEGNEGPADLTVVDPSVLQTLADEIGSPEIAGSLVETFLGELDERIAAIQQGVTLDADEACRAAHTLKGTAATMGAVELAEISGQIEHIFRSGGSGGETEALASALPAAGERCRIGLNKVVEDMGVTA